MSQRLPRRPIALFLLAAILGAMLLTLPGCEPSGPQSVFTQTKLGKVQGVIDSGINVFRGIPFARPPVADLRFKPPQPVAAWNGTFHATQYGPVPIQPLDQYEGSSYFTQDEDCLNLNVWTPKADGGARPVMVFIPGGGWTNGAGSDYSYSMINFARRGGVVGVTINYRLGPLGFLYLGGIDGANYAESGNLGILDQVEALKWVRDNISAFGGDPGNVTVVGESAGSMSVSTLMGIPAGKGLFKRAIGESGALDTIRNVPYAAQVTQRFMKLAGVTDVAGLQKLTAEQIVRAENKLMAQEFQTDMLFGPVVDGVVLPEPPLHAIAKGSAKDIPLLTGTNLDEVRYWALYIPDLTSITLDIAASQVPFVKSALDNNVAAIDASYRSRRPNATDGDVTMAVGTDTLFRIPAIRMVEAQSAQQPKTWMYLFTWPSPVENGVLGSCHAIELPFVFDLFTAPFTDRFIGTDPPANLADIMQNTWISFAKTGDPNNGTLPNWTTYDGQTRSTMELNVQPHVVNDPYGADRRVWDGMPFDGVTPSMQPTPQ
jgi:para-nitrobenzyl esterase